MAKNMGKKAKTKQTWRSKKFKIEKIKIRDGGGIDSWRYVACVCRPILWPAYLERLLENPTLSLLLMEDNAPLHNSNFINSEREKEGVKKIEWPLN